MSLNSVNQTPHNTNIYRPQTFSTLRDNMAQFYERTSEFVDEQFKELAEAPNSQENKSRKLFTPNPEEDTPKPRIQPRGMGTMIDMLI